MDNQLLPALPETLNKVAIAGIAESVVNNLMEGNGNPVSVAEAVAALEEFCSKMRENKDFVTLVRDEVSKYPGGMILPSGAKIELMEAGTKYDYSKDGIWNELAGIVKAAKTNQSAREAILKAIPAGQSLVDATTGEVSEAPTKKSTSTYKISLEVSKKVKS